MKSGQLPGMTIELAKQGNLIYAQGYGVADVRTGLQTRSNSVFPIGSVTKTFTAAAVLQLQSSGELDIDDPVITYLPSYPFDSRITVRMLLNQISGLEDYTTFPSYSAWESGVSEQAVLTAIAQAPLQSTPGSGFFYSNSNYFVLGSIIEIVSGAAYSDYLATRITAPLELTQTSFTQPQAAAVPDSLIPDPSVSFSAGALWSDVQDLATWDAALFRGQVLPASLFTEMVTPPQSIPSSAYAMGWIRTTELNRPFVWHDGEIAGATAYNGLFLDDGFSLSILTNEPPAQSIAQFAELVIQQVCTSSLTAC